MSTWVWLLQGPQIIKTAFALTEDVATSQIPARELLYLQQLQAMAQQAYQEVQAADAATEAVAQVGGRGGCAQALCTKISPSG
jgi:hypothetical protein